MRIEDIKDLEEIEAAFRAGPTQSDKDDSQNRWKRNLRGRSESDIRQRPEGSQEEKKQSQRREQQIPVKPIAKFHADIIFTEDKIDCKIPTHRTPILQDGISHREGNEP